MMLLSQDLYDWLFYRTSRDNLRLIKMSSYLSLHFKYTIVFFTIYSYIMNTRSDKLPDGLIAQLLEHCTDIAEVMGSSPALA